jgi:FAD/FMN-containing dehydrogenase
MTEGVPVEPIVGVRPHWENWSGNLSADPAAIFCPETLEDLVEIVGRARRDGRRIRVAGCGHSTSPLVPTEDYLVLMTNFTAITVEKTNPDGPRLTVEAGALVADVDRVMTAHGVAFPSNVVPSDVQMAGITSIGGHGSGISNATVSDYVTEIEMVTADGSVRRLSASEDGFELMDAVRVSLGLFGVIYRITYRVVPTFLVKVSDTKPSMRETIENIEAIAGDHWFVDLYWIPYNEQIWMKTLDPVEAVPGNQQHLMSRSVADRKTMGHAADEPVANFIVDLMIKYPEITPDVCRLLLGILDTQEAIQDVTDALHYQESIPIMKRLRDVGFGFPVGNRYENVKTSWFYVVDRLAALEAEGRFPMNFGMEARFIRGSSATMSFVGGEGVHCVMEIAAFAGTQGWPEFYVDVSRHWMETVGALPAWSKEFQDIPEVAAYIRRSYGTRIEQFDELRRAFDPEGRFLNDLLATIFVSRDAMKPSPTTGQVPARGPAIA